MAEADRVIVAGAGPVGMTAASYLAMHDIPVLVLEAGDDLATDLRASTWHPPTLDMLDFFDGLTGEIAEWGLVAPAWQYRDRETGPVATWDMGLLRDDTNHPYRLQTEQWKLTRLLHRRMADVPHFDLRFGHEVTGAGQDGNRALGDSRYRRRRSNVRRPLGHRRRRRQQRGAPVAGNCL